MRRPETGANMHAEMATAGTAHSSVRGPAAAEISRELVRLNATLYGRGPVKAKTYINEDCVVTILQSVFTTAEKTLIRIGKADEVRRARAAFTEATEEEMCAIVERATGRAVAGCVGGVHTEVDAAVKVFLFGAERSAPLDGDGAFSS
jgi:uncharacterized protein YbcI